MGAVQPSVAAQGRSFIPAQFWPWPRALEDTRDSPVRIEVGVPAEMAEDVFLLRLPLPFALNHINVYLIHEDEGWVLVDCGVDTAESREIWERIASRVSPLNRIIVTHHHPDHIGLAGWLAERFDAPVSMTAGEYAVAGRYADPDRDIIAERFPLWLEHGLSKERSTALLAHMPRYDEQVSRLSADRVGFIDPQQPMRIGRRRWQPIIGRGHAPEHLSLLEESGELLIGGDQVLPTITPNIAVWPGGDQNPLESYFRSLDRFLEVPADTLLLPSHRQPLYGVAARARQILAHHDDRLHVLWEACADWTNACELLPALFGRPLRDAEIGFGLGEAIAHLNYLEGRGYLDSDLDGNGVRVFRRCAESTIDQGSSS